MSVKSLSLNGSWQFTDAGNIKWQNGTVPGCVQMDLMALGQLSDPFYRMNEYYCHELEQKGWIYKKAFHINKYDCDAAKLVFEGIDTLADVYLNGVYLGRAENMFIPYEYDVNNVLVAGDNIIEVRFDSPVKTIRSLEQNSPVKLLSSAESARPYVRKAQYSYGWDWGPRIAQTGLWRPVHLDFIKDAKLKDVFFYTIDVKNGKARVCTRGSVTSYVDSKLSVSINISFEGKNIALVTVPVDSQPHGLGFSSVIDIIDPHLWYPNGMGAQPLYDIDIRLLRGQDEVDKLMLRSGIRIVCLIRQRDVEGESFIFEINSIKVFAKGANWIPADSMLPRLTREDYYNYVQLAKEANMNMLRVWGGGIYENNSFYDACDEMGIMVWQDFMYACAQYPDQFDWFQKLARDEAISVVCRLRSHPSIVLWCGNNENNWGFHLWWGMEDPKYLGNYIYKQMLPGICAEYDPSRSYWTSSPYGGKDPNSQTEGDRHQWDVWSGWQDYSIYVQDTGRFLSEFGFQAMPCWKTVLSYTAPEDRHTFSQVMLSHNRMSEGTERLIRFLVGRIGLPKDMRSFVYLTQFNQAEAIKTGVEHWRSRKFMTAGTLYWQFNDCWPVASWSCLDYYKRKKALYYYSRRFYNEVLIYLKAQNNGLEAYVVNDAPRGAEGVMYLRVYSLSGDKISEITCRAIIPSNSVVKIGHWTAGQLGIGYEGRIMMEDIPGCTLPVEKNGALLDSVVFAEINIGGKVYTNYAVFDRYRNLALHRPNISVRVQSNKITLVSDKPAFGVFIEPSEDIILSNNCLAMEPHILYTVNCSGTPGKVEVMDITQLRV